MTRRFIAVCLTVAVLCTCMAAPVSAAEDDSAWVELLQYSTVDNSGANLFKVTNTATISIDTPQYMRCTKIDMLVTHPAGQAPTAVKVRYNSVYYSLTIKTIDSTTVRIYGDNIPDTLYANVVIQFTKTSTTAVQYQLLSCRVSALNAQNFMADATFYMAGKTYNYGTAASVAANSTSPDYIKQDQIRIDVNDWMKFDELTIWGSSTNLPVSSIRATVGTLGLPIEVSYMDMTPLGSESFEWNNVGGYVYEDGTVEIYEEGGSIETVDAEGKWLYCVTVDLTGVDRTETTSPLYVYMTGFYEPVNGYTFNLQYVNGAIIVADTTEVTWWTRFTAFMSSLFGSDKQDEADNQSATIESQVTDMENAMDEMDTVTKPDIDDVDVNAGAYVDPDAMATTGEVLNEFMMNEMVLTMMLIAATVGLGAFIVF